MFHNTLNEVNCYFGTDLHSNFSEASWRKGQNEFLNIFHHDLEPLNSLANESPFDNIFQHSKSEYVLWPANGVVICDFRIRPNNQYYTVLDKPIPQPDNPHGPSAAGLEVCVSVYRSIERNNILYPANVEIKFEVWGHYERVKFKEFYKNYKRPIEVIMSNIQLDFYTACVFENIEKYKGNDIVRKLNLYLPKHDSEALFAVSKTINRNSNKEFVMRHFRNMLIIYHSLLGYCTANPQLDLILNYSNIINGMVNGRITSA